MQKRSVGFFLALGILFMPYIFSLYTLRSGFSVLARTIALGWLIFLVIFINTLPDSPTKSTQQPVQKEISKQEAVKTSEPSVQQPTHQASAITNQAAKKSISDERFLVQSAETHLYGYINKNGKIVIPPQFSEAGEFSNGLAQIRENGKSGYINTYGEIVIAPIFDDVISDTTFQDVKFMDNGLARVEIRHKNYKSIGYINKSGEFVIPIQFGFGRSFSEGLAFVSIYSEDGNKAIKEGYIDESGKFVIETEFEGSFGDFKNGLAPFQREKTGLSLILNHFATYGKYGYIDKSGDIVIDEQFDYAGNFNDNGLAGVTVNNKHGFINKKGKVVIPLTLTATSGIFSSNGLVPVSEGENHGYMNEDGKFVLLLPPEIKHSDVFADNGLAQASIKNADNESRYGFIDVKGRFVIPPNFLDAEDFKNGLAQVAIKTEGEWRKGYINERGEWVSDFEILGDVPKVTQNDEVNSIENPQPTAVNQPSESVQEAESNAGLDFNAESVAKTDIAQTIKANASSTELIGAMIQFANDYEKQIEARKRVEALPKPKHGNKKEARKLNDQALALAKQANYQDALPIMESAYKADSADVEIANNLAYLEIMLNDVKSAEKYLFETLILKPDRSGAWADLGRVFVAEGNEEYAKNCYINFFISSKNPEAALKHLTTEVPDNPVLTRVKLAANEEISLWSSGD
jgi:Flp pilus assembly protein TadD